MNATRNPVRALWVLAAVALFLMLTAAAAFGRGNVSSAGTGSAGSAVAIAPVARPPDAGVAMPTWCCPSSGTVPGLTTYGQAAVTDQGQAARDAAIADAVKDASAQAHAAADAAGIQLGALIDMQVSATPYVYPIAEAKAGSAVAVPPGAATGVDIAKGAPMQPYYGDVSVTMTWALG